MTRYRPTSHETFSHGDLDSLGYDWGRIADPHVAPRHPLKVYLPETTDEVIAVVREAKKLDQRLIVRSKGHSSNDLVLGDRSRPVLCTEHLNRVLEVSRDGTTVKVQAGAVLAEVDQYLWRLAYGLPVIGDHNHITAGGFASVGGVSPASHRYGMFVDNVAALEYVDWNGRLVSCSPEQDSDRFYRVLAGTGQDGVITTLTCRIRAVDKLRTILENRRTITRDLERFLEVSSRVISHPGEAEMERGLWLDLPVLGKPFAIGQFSDYRKTEQSWLKALRNRIAHGYLHALGYVAGRLPRMLDLIVQYLGVLGIILAPRYASIKNVEAFADKVLDATVGDPSRMLIVFAPAEKYADMFRALYELCREYRAAEGCVTYISVYVKGIDSPYLACGSGKHFCELVLWLGIDPERMSTDTLNRLVGKIDDLCVVNGAFRYMHTKTVKDDLRRGRIDPNALYRKAGDTPSRAAL